MACMKHVCTRCNYADFNNSPRTPSICPKCGEDMLHTWDEQYDDSDYEAEPEEEEDLPA